MKKVSAYETTHNFYSKCKCLGISFIVSWLEIIMIVDHNRAIGMHRKLVDATKNAFLVG